MTPQPLKNNPSHRTDEELIREFVVRQPDLELILERLRENRGASNQHLIIRGPRGMGKTTLVNRVIAEIRADDALAAAWYPIAFNEESYAVTSAAELWLQALVHLAEQTRDPALERLAEQLRGERDDQRLRERAVARLEAFHDADRPFFEIFWEHALRPLEIPEIRAIWEAVTGEEIAERRARPIQILTGGNTRLLVMLASFARGRPFRALVDDLIGLIDENTPYFKHNIESLPKEERKIFVALADLWSPATARQVADYTRSDVRSASALLGRLVHRGAVESIRQIGATQLYQVAERMYNLYHLLRRRNSERVRLLIEFMVRFYDVHQIHDAILPGLAAEACTSDGDDRRELIHTIFKLVSPAHMTRAWPRLPVAFRELPEVHAALQTFAPRPAHDRPLDETTLLAATEQRLDDPAVWIALAAFQWSQQQPEASLSSYKRAWTLSPNDPVCAINIVALSKALDLDPANTFALTHLPAVLAQRGELDAAIDLLRDGIERVPEFIPLRRQLHTHLVTKGELDEAERVLVEAFRITPDDAPLRLEYAEFLLKKRHNPAQAEQLITPILARDDLRVRSTYLLILSVQRKRREAEAFMARFDAENPPSNDTLVARAMLMLMQERPREAAKLLSHALSQGNSDAQLLNWYVAASLASGAVSDLRTYLTEQIMRVLALPDIGSRGAESVSSFAPLSAALGDGGALIKAIEESPNSKLLEPLLVALRRHEGIAQNPPHEVSQVADDLLKRISEIKQQLEALKRNVATIFPIPGSPQPERPQDRPDPPAKWSKTKKRRDKPKRA